MLIKILPNAAVDDGVPPQLVGAICKVLGIDEDKLGKMFIVTKKEYIISEENAEIVYENYNQDKELQ